MEEASSIQIRRLGACYSPSFCPSQATVSLWEPVAQLRRAGSAKCDNRVMGPAGDAGPAQRLRAGMATRLDLSGLARMGEHGDLTRLDPGGRGTQVVATRRASYMALSRSPDPKRSS